MSNQHPSLLKEKGSTIKYPSSLGSSRHIYHRYEDIIYPLCESISIFIYGINSNDIYINIRAIQLNETAKALQNIAGIDIFADKGKTQVKDMVTIMDELSQKWGSLNDKQQKALSEGIAGKTQSAVFQSLLNNWSRVKQFQDVIKYNYKNNLIISIVC